MEERIEVVFSPFNGLSAEEPTLNSGVLYSIQTSGKKIFSREARYPLHEGDH